jgi:hypothetical protein
MPTSSTIMNPVVAGPSAYGLRRAIILSIDSQRQREDDH